MEHRCQTSPGLMEKLGPGLGPAALSTHHQPASAQLPLLMAPYQPRGRSGPQASRANSLSTHLQGPGFGIGPEGKPWLRPQGQTDTSPFCSRNLKEAAT